MSVERRVVFGESGQIASALKELWQESAIYLSREISDLLKPQMATSQLERLQPKLVILCSAFTKVDDAEKNQDSAKRLNGEAPGEIANWCAKNGARLIYFSTDYVYSGRGEKPWMESDTVKPVNFYGETKLLGEREILRARCRHLILRTSWVYSHTGQNFVRTMLRLAQEEPELRVVHDQFGSPNYAPDLAKATDEILQKWIDPKQDGVYNFAGLHFCSWFEFATGIMKRAQILDPKFKMPKLTAITTNEYPTPAERPLNSRLNVEKLAKTFQVTLPDWPDGLNRCLRRLYAR